MAIKPSSAGNNFFAYCRAQRLIIAVALIGSALLFLLLKYVFPYPDLFVDSTNYILWALRDFVVAYRPTGYATFLQLVHVISPSAIFTVLVQYMLFVFSTLLLFLSADYLFGLPAKYKVAILFVTVFNPLLILQANMISSDSVFCSLSVFWLSSCMWVIKKHGWLAMAAQVICLFFCFQVRYTAMFYPAIAIIAFICCGSKMPYRIAGILLSASVLVFSVQRQKSLNEKYTGMYIFSGFSGWQLANNALYCYKHIDVNTNDLPDEQTQFIDHLVKTYIDSVKTAYAIGSEYMWDPHSPLKKYLNYCAYRDKSQYFWAWYKASAPLSNYGKYIISHYPMAYTRYFILPNAAMFFYPPTLVLSNYDYGGILVTNEAKEWFGWDIEHLDCRFPLLQSKIIVFYPALILLINILNIAAMAYGVRSAFKGELERGVKAMFVVWLFFYLGFMVFSIFAAVIELRYLDLLFVTGIIVPFIFLGKVGQKATESLV